ncbi:MAG: sulfatase [Planctomycetales bacterium]|nr:sulfatase [Planctomycetales bacterium]
MRYLKLWWLITTLPMLFGLGGCGASTPSSTSPTETSTDQSGASPSAHGAETLTSDSSREPAASSAAIVPTSPSLWEMRADAGDSAPGETLDAAAAAGRNVIFVSVDALQAAHVGGLGYPRRTTPSLDAFARCSFQFSHCYSVASWTVPSSMTWFTGVYPSEHRIVNKYAVYDDTRQTIASLKQLAPNLTTLAQELQSHGYRTAGFCGNAGVSRGFGYDTGFEVYDHESAKFGTFDYSLPRAVNWLEQRGDDDKPFFLFVHGYDVHGQAMPSDGFDGRFVSEHYDRRFAGTSQEQEYLREEGLDRGQLDLRPEDIEFWRAIYDEKIARADAKLESFFRDLDRLGLLDNTLIIVTSDHGTEFCEHGRFDHGFTLYNEQIHVPLWIHLPGQVTGVDLPQPVSSIDVMPTILELLGVAPSDAVKEQSRGESLVGAMRGDGQSRYLFCETDYREFTFKRAVISPDRWKLIYTLETRERELYDLNQDPGEQNNVVAAHPALADELEGRLFDHFRLIGHDLRARSWQPGYNPVYSFPSGN